MNKQEFLAMSLPYNVYAVFGFIPSEYRIGNYYDEFDSKIVTSMPILHPLSDLIKPITHKGETFVPCERIANMSYREIHADWFMQHNIECLPFYVFQFLISIHFDLADLIGKGEAIDINTLNENPYE